MSLYKKKLIMFVTEKQLLLSSAGITEISYVVPEDIDALYSLTEDQCRDMFLELEDAILVSEASGLDRNTHPFCFLYTVHSCRKDCVYGKVHGVCTSVASDMFRLRKLLNSKGRDILSAETYRSLLAMADSIKE